ncbi:MAG: hypothetical protein FWE40_01630 [Oscillospiraceae bacterium]|nr:hypothetical protein [Oscillospiraceae bacterium]
MAKGDFFRSQVGGFHKDDVLQYIEALEQRMHLQAQATQRRTEQLRQARQRQRHWMAAARLQRRRHAAGDEVTQQLAEFARKLEDTQKIVAEVDRENSFLREKIRLLEMDPVIQAPVVPMEQLTLQWLLSDDDDDNEE